MDGRWTSGLSRTAAMHDPAYLQERRSRRTHDVVHRLTPVLHVIARCVYVSVLLPSTQANPRSREEHHTSAGLVKKLPELQPSLTFLTTIHSQSNPSLADYLCGATGGSGRRL